MPKADNIIAPLCELSIRIQLRKAGMRLERTGFTYTIVYKNQVLLSGNGQGDALALTEVAAFIERALVR